MWGKKKNAGKTRIPNMVINGKEIKSSENTNTERDLRGMRKRPTNYMCAGNTIQPKRPHETQVVPNRIVEGARHGPGTSEFSLSSQRPQPGASDGRDV